MAELRNCELPSLRQFGQFRQFRQFNEAARASDNVPRNAAMPAPACREKDTSRVTSSGFNTLR